ncbi:hypothetical protein D6779_02220 [Candidatus Parcubacteria bacterium]|nr:MAG: hypothetical protein D6779_02220 [Candidatus Parcubacteria bacterium]
MNDWMDLIRVNLELEGQVFAHIPENLAVLLHEAILAGRISLLSDGEEEADTIENLWSRIAAAVSTIDARSVAALNGVVLYLYGVSSAIVPQLSLEETDEGSRLTAKYKHVTLSVSSQDSQQWLAQQLSMEDRMQGDLAFCFDIDNLQWTGWPVSVMDSQDLALEIAYAYLPELSEQEDRSVEVPANTLRAVN